MSRRSRRGRAQHHSVVTPRHALFTEPPPHVHVVNDAYAAGLAEARYGAAARRAAAWSSSARSAPASLAMIMDSRLVPNSKLLPIEIDAHDAE